MRSKFTWKLEAELKEIARGMSEYPGRGQTVDTAHLVQVVLFSSKLYSFQNYKVVHLRPYIVVSRISRKM